MPKFRVVYEVEVDVEALSSVQAPARAVEYLKSIGVVLRDDKGRQIIPSHVWKIGD